MLMGAISSMLVMVMVRGGQHYSEEEGRVRGRGWVGFLVSVCDCS